jgi:macrolide transport system ATP-binding/permease protein
MPGQLLSDFRFAVRQLLKSRVFTITAIVVLALGIGANTAIFTLVHAVMLKSLPVADPQRLIRLGDGDNCCVIGGYQGRFSIYAYSLYTYLRDHTPEFEEMAAFQAGFGKVGVRRRGSGVSEPFVSQFVSGNYFSLFGLQPYAGRLLSSADDVPGAAPIAVMSYRAWRERYGADHSIIGTPFIIDGYPYTLAGVAPPGFFGDTLRPDPPDFWMPLANEPAGRRQNSLLARKDQHWLYIIGRIRRHAQVAPVESEVNVSLRQWFLANDPPRDDRERQELQRQHITLAPGGSGITQLRQYFSRDLRLLMGITGLVLLIACANLANLQLARSVANHGQISIRVALGAQRSRLVRQMLTESALLGVVGGAVGLTVAIALAAVLMRLAFSSFQSVPINPTPSLPVLGFTFLLSLITGIIFGTVPAWLASRADPAGALRGAGRSASSRTTMPQKSLVVLQAALSLVLLAGAGLMVQTLRNLQNQQFGFETQGTVVVNVNAGFSSYAPEKIASIYGEIERQMRQISDVRNAALALYVPMSGNNWQSGISVEGKPRQTISPSWDRVSPTFFDTIGAHILRGRSFDERDTANAPQVTIVNQKFVEQYFPNEDPVGKRFGLGGVEHSGDYQIVGVVNTIRFRDLRHEGRPFFFLPMLQLRKSEWSGGMARSSLIGSIILRVAGTPPNLVSKIQSALASIDPNLTILSVRTTTDLIENQLRHELLIARLAEFFGALALLLASIGLYGITAYSVARRTSEIGVRTALGATRVKVVRLILGGALVQVAVGLLLGIPAALGAGRILADQLYGVKSSDPLVLSAAAVVLAACAAAAGLIPALRASSVDPVRALRIDA